MILQEMSKLMSRQNNQLVEQFFEPIIIKNSHKLREPESLAHNWGIKMRLCLKTQESGITRCSTCLANICNYPRPTHCVPEHSKLGAAPMCRERGLAMHTIPTPAQLFQQKAVQLLGCPFLLLFSQTLVNFEGACAPT